MAGTVSIRAVASLPAADTAQTKFALGTLWISALRAVFQTPLVPHLNLGICFVGSPLASSQLFHPLPRDLVAVLVKELPLGSIGILGLALFLRNLLAVGLG